MEPKTLPHFWKRNMYQYHQFVSNSPGVTSSIPMLSQMDIFSPWYYVVQNWDAWQVFEACKKRTLKLLIPRLPSPNLCEKSSGFAVLWRIFSTAQSFFWWGKKSESNSKFQLSSSVPSNNPSLAVRWAGIVSQKSTLFQWFFPYIWGKIWLSTLPMPKNGPIFTARISRSLFVYICIFSIYTHMWNRCICKCNYIYYTIHPNIWQWYVVQ